MYCHNSNRSEHKTVVLAEEELESSSPQSASFAGELYTFLDNFERIFRAETGNSFGINEFYQEISDSNFFVQFFGDLKMELTTEEEALYLAGRWKDYWRTVRSYPFWASGACKLSNWIDIGVVALLTVSSIFMEIPESISATVGITAFAIIANGIVDFYNAYTTSAEMRETEKSKDLHDTDLSIWQRANIKYTWPLYATMFLTMSLLGVYGVFSIKDDSISESSTGFSLSTQYSINKPIQHASLFVSIVISALIRKFNISFLEYQKEYVNFKAQNYLLNQLISGFKVQITSINQRVSEGEASIEQGPLPVWQKIIEQILNYVCKDEKYLLVELCNALRQAALLQVRWLDLRNCLQKYPELLNRNKKLLKREELLLVEKIIEIRNRFKEYLQEIFGELTVAFRKRMLKSELVEAHLLTKNPIKVTSILLQLACSQQEIENYIEHLDRIKPLEVSSVFVMYQ